MKPSRASRSLAAATLAAACAAGTAVAQPRLQVARSTFIYETAPFPSAHASTIVETPDGLVASWFGGTEEKHPDVGIWVSRHEGGRWTAPVEVANGVQADGKRHPTWNPVLFQPSRGPLLLFYKVGPSPRDWWGMVMSSTDRGRTWSSPVRLPDGILGPIRAKPVELPDGTILAGSSTEHRGWVVHMERTTVEAAAKGARGLAEASAWTKTGPLNDAGRFDAIQPTILVHSPSRLQILCRSQQRAITSATSEDGGRTWGAMTALDVPNPSAGIDAVRLADGRFLLVYNPTTKGRHQLALATSTDGRAWTQVLLLENTPGEYSYPAMIQAKDGTVHVTYTWRREKVKHVQLTIAD